MSESLWTGIRGWPQDCWVYSFLDFNRQARQGTSGSGGNFDDVWQSEAQIATNGFVRLGAFAVSLLK
jgi:hypothetical protein